MSTQNIDYLGAATGRIPLQKFIMNQLNIDGTDHDACEIPFKFRDRSSTLRMERCSGRDQVVRQIEETGWQSYEAPLPNVICELIASRNSTFLDIGANSGFYSLIAASGGCKDVRAFEPVPFIAELLRRNIKHSRTPDTARIKIFQEALSDRQGPAEIYIPDQQHGLIETSASLNREFRSKHSDKFIVKTTTIDDHVQNHPLNKNCRLVIKIDVESLEETVIKGSLKTIQNYRPAILVEVLPGANLDFYKTFMDTHEYTHYPLLHYINRLVASPEIHPSHHQRDHLLMPAEQRPPAILDKTMARWYGRILWLRDSVKRTLSR